VHFANDIRDSLTVGLLVVLALSRNLGDQRQRRAMTASDKDRTPQRNE
jgi:hypothetical protein